MMNANIEIPKSTAMATTAASQVEHGILKPIAIHLMPPTTAMTALFNGWIQVRMLQSRRVQRRRGRAIRI